MGQRQGPQEGFQGHRRHYSTGVASHDGGRVFAEAWFRNYSGGRLPRPFDGHPPLYAYCSYCCSKFLRMHRFLFIMRSSVERELYECVSSKHYQALPCDRALCGVLPPMQLVGCLCNGGRCGCQNISSRAGGSFFSDSSMMDE